MTSRPKRATDDRARDTYGDTATESHVSVYCKHASGRISMASADQHEPECWWIARVKVDDREQGRLVGTALLARLVRLVFEAGAREIVVAPGGYGSDESRLRKFYGRAGFVCRPDGVMVLERRSWAHGRKIKTHVR